jgi:poly(A) polymerase
MQLQGQGVQAVEAQRRAADRVTVHQLTTIALPRRFSLPMQEIWLLQSRLSSTQSGQRQRKRVMRTLAHPRFRAAFDFLALRQVASDEHTDDIAFWRDAQNDPDNAIALHPEPEGEGDDTAAAPRRRRRRRRPAASAE